ncbi:MAG: hypothetical protein EZS28_005410 [Streblomastix strix]|uniref:Uncharacterized protein n=1 Tax=Streblomastix strix TaxID=222440 RepID=A0A5J4WVT6_9EUKA|nr:MAG: hypothetical protein EZS28_005410 [Streblomastix strix]
MPLDRARDIHHYLLISFHLEYGPMLRNGGMNCFLDSNPSFEKARKAHYYQTLTRLQKRHAKLIIFKLQPFIRKGTQSSFDVDTYPNYQ